MRSREGAGVLVAVLVTGLEGSGAEAESVGFERAMAWATASGVGSDGGFTGLRACAQGVVQMLFECPQA